MSKSSSRNKTEGDLKMKVPKSLLLIFTAFIFFYMSQNLFSSDMVKIPAGKFKMGSNDVDTDEKPVHTVYISEFYIDKYEVTNGEYKKCVASGRCRVPEYSKSYTRSSYFGDSRFDNYPVIYVIWDDAKKYCAWKGGRLPTEAEWEYAARGGLSGVKYPNGDSIDCGDANFERWNSSEKCWNYGGKSNDTHSVGSYAANGYGLYDMAGNVWEWVSDWYGDNYYSSSPSRNPKGLSSGYSRVLRGGSWSDYAFNIRVAFRVNNYPAERYFNYGFRCAR